MENLNIPIYRAKKIDSDEYIVGYLVEEWEYKGKNKRFFYGIKRFKSKATIEIDPTTLSIHFHDMIDSQGNKIFASLSEDGKGGDIVSYLPDEYDNSKPHIAIYEDFKFHAVPQDSDLRDLGMAYKMNPRLKIVGIQKWQHKKNSL